MEGIAQRVHREREGANTVLRFVVADAKGRPVAVEMRGHEIRGLLHEDDQVAFDLDSARMTRDGVRRPLQVRNETTGSLVVAWRSPLLRRATTPMPSLFASAVVSSGTTLVLTGLVKDGDSEGSPGASSSTTPLATPSPSVSPAPTSTTSSTPSAVAPEQTHVSVGIYVGIAIVVLLAAAYLSTRRLSMRGKEPSRRPVAAGLLLGVVAASLLVALGWPGSLD